MQNVNTIAIPWVSYWELLGGQIWASSEAILSAAAESSLLEELSPRAEQDCLYQLEALNGFWAKFNAVHGY